MQLWRVRQTWDGLGRRDPLWAVLTWPDKQGNKWTIEEFLATGRAEVDRLVQYLERVAPTCPRRNALDFGCGVGRVSQALATRFDRVVGLDVAPSMIAQARAVNGVPDRCSFELNRSRRLRRFSNDSFDLVYSRMVLQHMAPSLARGYLRELVRVLAPGGALVFQLPERMSADSMQLFLNAPVEGNALKRRLPRPFVRAWRAAKYGVIAMRRARDMEMHGIDKDAVVALLESTGARILDIHDDHAHGTSAPGFEYCVTK
jgi:ubiquinone/menaquinone biosynthesis C-methylase UbiE